MDLETATALLDHSLAGFKNDTSEVLRTFVEAHRQTMIDVATAYLDGDDLRAGQRLGALLIAARGAMLANGSKNMLDAEGVRAACVHLRRAHSILLDGVVALQAAEDAARAAKH